MVNKKQLIEEVAAKTGMTKIAVAKTLSAAVEVVTEKLAEGERISVSGFGVIELQHRCPRIGRNPHTGEPVDIAARDVIRFKPTRSLNEKCQPK